jgi:predicted site-specific integrase-resolvase
LGALDDWAQLDDAVTITGRSEKTIYRWARHGKVRTLRPGDVLWFNISDLRKQKKNMPGRPRKTM